MKWVEEYLIYEPKHREIGGFIRKGDGIGSISSYYIQLLHHVRMFYDELNPPVSGTFAQYDQKCVGSGASTIDR